MKPKGMHEIHTAHTLISRSMPATRPKVMIQLARMEQERERLEGELALWMDKQRETERRLEQVRQHIKLLRQALDELPADEGGEDGSTRGTAGDDRKTKGWPVIPLEY